MNPKFHFSVFCLQLLECVRRGVSLLVRNSGGCSALHIAAQNGHAELVSYILQQGESVHDVHVGVCVCDYLRGALCVISHVNKRVWRPPECIIWCLSKLAQRLLHKTREMCYFNRYKVITPKIKCPFSEVIDTIHPVTRHCTFNMKVTKSCIISL